MKRLLLTCTDLMAIQFLVPHVKYLLSHGFSVELACSVVGDRLGDLHRELDGIAPIHTVRLVRSPFSLSFPVTNTLCRARWPYFLNVSRRYLTPETSPVKSLTTIP